MGCRLSGRACVLRGSCAFPAPKPTLKSFGCDHPHAAGGGGGSRSPPVPGVPAKSAPAPTLRPLIPRIPIGPPGKQGSRPLAQVEDVGQTPGLLTLTCTLGSWSPGTTRPSTGVQPQAPPWCCLSESPWRGTRRSAIFPPQPLPAGLSFALTRLL